MIGIMPPPPLIQTSFISMTYMWQRITHPVDDGAGSGNDVGSGRGPVI